MVELEQYKFTVNQYKEPMKELGVSLALSHKHEQIKELESEMREEGRTCTDKTSRKNLCINGN